MLSKRRREPTTKGRRLRSALGFLDDGFWVGGAPPPPPSANQLCVHHMQNLSPKFPMISTSLSNPLRPPAGRAVCARQRRLLYRNCVRQRRLLSKFCNYCAAPSLNRAPRDTVSVSL